MFARGPVAVTRSDLIAAAAFFKLRVKQRENLINPT
jgi:hypothetical protein